MATNRYVCPVCGFPDLEEPPYDDKGCPTYEICPSCGTEFGYQDALTPHSTLRQRWIENGAKWSSSVQQPPPGWSASRQLADASLD